MTKQDSQLAQIRLMIEDIQSRPSQAHVETYSIDAAAARKFVHDVAAIIGKPFTRPKPERCFL